MTKQAYTDKSISADIQRLLSINKDLESAIFELRRYSASLESRVDTYRKQSELKFHQLEKQMAFHDISSSQVIGHNTQIEFLKSKTNATNKDLADLRETCAEFVLSTKQKPSSSMIEVYWLGCFAWGMGGVVVTLAALRFGGVI
jgi:predicted  nucleic acid-binding Zn-ribbon protein